ncbi:MAG: RHS repeat-associated core domain-containing protein, partial [Clostridia bacterium]|nr:RHS repeat-associated core domain-containing protein [Clostridia bacterium]
NIGYIVATYEYDAWGNITYQEGAIADINPFRYRGYYYDNETGFYYLQTRYYDPTTMRFINADNYELIAQLSIVTGKLNMYAYANNNPIMYTDETGEGLLTVFVFALLSAGANLLGQVLIEGKSLENVNLAHVGIEFATTFLTALIPGGGVWAKIGRAGCSSLLSNSAKTVFLGEEFNVRKIAYEAFLSFSLSYVSSGVSETINNSMSKLLANSGNHLYNAYLFSSLMLNGNKEEFYIHKIVNHVADFMFEVLGCALHQEG